MHRQILTSSAVVAVVVAALAATSMIWLMLTRPAEAVVALAGGDVTQFLQVVLDVVVRAVRAILEYL